MQAPGEPKVSTFEDLDPQHKANGARWRHPELLLGLALLLSIVVWGGCGWWQGQGRLADYRAGQHYAAQHQWDAARVAFLAADGYGDATQQAATSAQQIAARTRAYSAATGELALGAAAAAMRDLLIVRAIEPDYQQSERMYSDAARAVYSAALSGSVALRLTAEPPGLYVHRDAGWIWLRGSDAASQVLGSGLSCCIVYDVPRPGIEPASIVPTPIPRSARLLGWPMSEKTRRKAMVARWQGAEYSYQMLDLDPLMTMSYTWNNAGVTGLALDMGRPATGDTRLARLQPYILGNMKFTFQAYGSTATATLHVPAGPWAILDVRQQSGAVLLGDYSLARGKQPQTALYLAQPGGERRLLNERQAIVQRARLAEGGRYLAIEEFYEPAGASAERHQVVLLDLEGASPPLLLAQEDLPPAASVADSWFSFEFMNAGAYAGKLLLTDWNGGKRRLRLIDPADPRHVLWTSESNVEVSQAYSLAGGLALIERPSQESSAADPANDARYLDSAGEETGLQLGAAGSWLAPQLWQGAGRLVYAGTAVDAQLWQSDGRAVNATAGAATSDNKGLAYTIYSIALPSSQGAEAQPVLLYKDDGEGARPVAYGDRSWRGGPGLLAYLKAGELHALTYDGAIDLPLEYGVFSLFDPTP